MKLLKLSKKKKKDNCDFLLLTFNLCKTCGKCCFDCEFLDYKTGCKNEDFRLHSRCASFPLLFGNVEKLGYPTLHTITNTKNNSWFIFPLEECILLQDEIIFNNLRWLLSDVNESRKITWFFLQMNERKLELYFDNQEMIACD